MKKNEVVEPERFIKKIKKKFNVTPHKSVSADNIGKLFFKNKSSSFFMVQFDQMQISFKIRKIKLISQNIISGNLVMNLLKLYQKMRSSIIEIFQQRRNLNWGWWWHAGFFLVVEFNRACIKSMD